MLYTFGDSASFGSKFYLEGKSIEECRELSWPYLLSKRLGVELKDYSYPATGNWRVARILQGLDLKPEDIVLIQWSNSYRFEMGVSEGVECITAPEQKFRLNELLDCFQEEDGLKTKSMCLSLVNKTTDSIDQQFMSIAYERYFNYRWYDEMFKVMLTSCLYKLEKSGCQYMMFDGWIPACYPEDFTDVPQYVFRGTTMANLKRGYPGTQLPDKSYPDERENMFFAELLEKKYKEMYCNANENENVYVPELLKKYA